MSWENGCQRGWVAAVMAVCAMASSCVTRDEAQNGATAVEAVPEKHEATAKKRRSAETLRKMREIVIPEISFRPPDTIIDAIDFFYKVGRDYDKPENPEDGYGFSFILKLPSSHSSMDDNIFAPDGSAGTDDDRDVPVIPAMSARFISLHDALKLVCDATGMRIRLDGALVMIVPVWDHEEVEQRIYDVSPDQHERMRTVTDDLKLFFAGMGVRWPEGSSVEYDKGFGKLFVTNTPEQLVLLDQIILPCPVCGFNRRHHVYAEVQIVAFRARDVEKLLLNGGMTKAALMALRKAGKSKPVATASAVANLEQEFCVKAVREVLSPNVPHGESDPNHFTMREVGMIFQAIPTIGCEAEDTFVEMSLRTQWVTQERWGPRRQPVFGTTNFETQVKVNDGDTILLGSTTVPDGKWVHAGFLTVRLVQLQPPRQGVDVKGRADD
ncbi:MAG: hypothetical protein FWG50_05690 [Kiritimatiellaeota bacterium]|nr:hypothetical protein [Kiritimatiellota bacterium]